MKTDQQIGAHYDRHIDFFADNWSAAFDEMLYFRKMLREAHGFVETHRGDPEADNWLKKFRHIEDCEDAN